MNTKYNLSVKEIQRCIYNYWKNEKSYKIFSINTYGLGHEADMIAVHTENMFSVEFEIKRSKSDFLKDFSKKTKHSLLKCSKYPANMFYFVCEKGLLTSDDIPNHLGLILIDKIPYYENSLNKKKEIVKIKKYNYELSIVKNAKVLHNRPLPDNLLQKILISMMNKYFSEIGFKDKVNVSK